MVLYPDRLISYYKWKSAKLGSFNQSGILQRSFYEPFHLDWQYTGLVAIMLIMGVCNVIGDLVRNIQFPYPILLLAGGGVLGWYSDINESLDKFLQVTSLHPRVLLMIFLPAFVFRTAYNTDSRLFKICVWQILLVGFVGVITSSLVIGVILMVSLNKHGWTFENAYLFGSIASTTYPHMIINILQSTGQSKPLCVLLEGEYMIHDAYAMMVFYLIIFEIVSPNTGVLKNSVDIFLYWVCGLIIGLVLGRIITYCAQRFFTNVNQLILITVSATYLAFYLCEDIEDFSGVVAVASMGMMLGRAKNSFASNIGLLLSETWESLCLASEAVVFILIGLMMVKNLNDRFDWDDLLLAIIVYIITNVSSGLSWQNAIVAMWGGLHGILSMLLALMAARTSHFVHIGPQFTILMTMIVILTYLINGSSITVVLSKLGLLTISSSRKANMRKALASLYDIRERHFSILKLAKYFPMVNWKVVDEATTINNPYNKGKDKTDDDFELGNDFEGPHMSVCPSCKKVHYGIPNENELKEMRRIAQLKMLHARKAMYWRQLQRGMISKNGALFLVHCVENALVREKMNIDMNEIKALWTEKYFYKFYKYCFKMVATDRGTMVADVTRRWRILFFTIVSRKSFVYFYCCIIIIHDLIIIEEFATKLFLTVWLWNKVFNIFNLIFTALYGIEIVFKVGAYGFYLYTRERLNNIDLILMVTCTLNVVIDVVLTLGLTRGTVIQQFIIDAGIICRLLNLVRTVRLLKVLIPIVSGILYSRMQIFMCEAFEVCHNFLWIEEQILVLLDFIVIYEELRKELWAESDSVRFDMMRLLASIQTKTPGVEIDVKTTLAIQGTLIYLKEYLKNLKEIEGHIDTQEYMTLVNQIETKLRETSNTMTWDNTNTVSSILTSIPWLAFNKEFADFIEDRGIVLKFKQGEQIYVPSQIPLKIYIVISGAFDVHFRLEDYHRDSEVQPGRLPIVDYLTNFDWKNVRKYDDFVEMVTLAGVIGELGYLTGRQYNSTVTCNTPLQVLCISTYVLNDAIKKFKGTRVKSLMWKSVTARFIPHLLSKVSIYQDKMLDEMTRLVSRALVVTLRGTKTLVVTGVVKEVVLLEGQVRDKEGNQYFGPSCLPHITLVTPADRKEMDPCILLVILDESAGECYIVDKGNQVKAQPLQLAKCHLHAMESQHPEVKRVRESLKHQD
ncbi:sodium/hydrogen exchanger 10-like isoform X4 [Bacillus rossius redtenbacheri]|uniref:sodium/hydrogen exchanger 10-like isoform X4 n=1 Tax=Bacillus rossius redtenbacheri TaxID=93214 RepID=UPI002FDD047E